MLCAAVIVLTVAVWFNSRSIRLLSEAIGDQVEFNKKVIDTHKSYYCKSSCSWRHSRSFIGEPGY